MNMLTLAAAAAAAALGAPATGLAVQPDPPAVPAGISVVQVVPPLNITCTAPVFGAKTRSVVIGDITSPQDFPVSNLINDRSVTSFTMNCGNGINGGMVPGNGLIITGPAGTISGTCVGC